MGMQHTLWTGEIYLVDNDWPATSALCGVSMLVSWVFIPLRVEGVAVFVGLVG